MSFLRKKRVKFIVELTVTRLTDVSLLNATLFAKVHLLECGSFRADTDPAELRGHSCVLYNPTTDSENNQTAADEAENRPTTSASASVELLTATSSDPKHPKQPYRFECRIPYDQQTGELEECRCKISIRRLERFTRIQSKLGFVIVNLSEFAASGSAAISRSYLLDGYSGKQRQDNSRVHIEVRMVHQMSDPLFKVPCKPPIADEAHLNPRDRKAPSCKVDEVEFRRNLGGEPIDDRPNSATGTVRLPNSSTLNSFSSSGSENAATNASTSNNSPPNLRFSVPSATERRTSAPMAATTLDRSSWHSDPMSFDFQRTHPGARSAQTSIGADLGLMLDLRRPSSSRRMSDDRIVKASQNVPNRVQQTRRDADSVIEEVLAEAAADFHVTDTDDDPNDTFNSSTDGAIDDPSERRSRGGALALFVSKKNGEALVGATSAQPQLARANFERVDTSLTG